MVVARHREFSAGGEAVESTSPVSDWKHEHCSFAVRRPVATEPRGIQQCLFTFKVYTCHRELVTTLELTAA